MTFNLNIELGNAAMQTPEDVAEALRRVAAQLDAGVNSTLASFAGTILDANGNSVGSFERSDGYPEFPYVILDGDGVVDRVRTEDEANQYIREAVNADDLRYEREV